MSTTTPAGPSTSSIASLMLNGVGAEGHLVQAGGHRDPYRAAVQHLGGERHRGPGQRRLCETTTMPTT